MSDQIKKQREFIEWLKENDMYSPLAPTSTMLSMQRVWEVYQKQNAALQAKVDGLKDFAIWMSGCGYDFCQHEYFWEQRDKLLKDGDQ